MRIEEAFPGQKVFEGVDLRGYDFSRGRYSYISFKGANLAGCPMSGASFYYCSFEGADLRNANLSSGQTGSCSFKEADLGGANLARIDLGGAAIARNNGSPLTKPSSLLRANLRGANLAGANLEGAVRGAKDPPLPGWGVEGGVLVRTEPVKYVPSTDYKRPKFDGKVKDPRGLKFYHASPVRFRAGDLLRGRRGGGSGYGSPHVYMSTSPVPHGTISGNIPGWPGFRPSEDSAQKGRVSDRDWYVYEVEPVGTVWYGESNLEYIADQAVVVKNLGKAISFLPQGGADPHSSNPLSYALSPEAERDRLRKRERRRQRSLDRIDERNQIEAALLHRVVRAYLEIE